MKLASCTLCDFCFTPIEEGKVCHKCGLTPETYNPTPGLLTPGVNLLGKYIIGQKIGRGGFGATYIAYSSDRKKPVAIKEFFPISISHRSTGDENVSIISDDKRAVFEKGAKNFYEEARTISKFKDNKGIVSVHEFFYANSTVYYSMEYLDGYNLKDYVKKSVNKIDAGKLTSIFRSVADALVTVHESKVLHRDITPDNIFVCNNGDVKLIDFGASKSLVSEEAQGYSVVLKPGFAPVEQYARNGKQGAWTDIYGLGSTMYYALTGKIPPDAMDRIENPELDFGKVKKELEPVVNIIRKCMACYAVDRYQSATELLNDLIPVDETINKKEKPIKKPEQAEENTPVAKPEQTEENTPVAKPEQTEENTPVEEPETVTETPEEIAEESKTPSDDDAPVAAPGEGKSEGSKLNILANKKLIAIVSGVIVCAGIGVAIALPNNNSIETNPVGPASDTSTDSAAEVATTPDSTGETAETNADSASEADSANENVADNAQVTDVKNKANDKIATAEKQEQDNKNNNKNKNKNKNDNNKTASDTKTQPQQSQHQQTQKPQQTQPQQTQKPQQTQPQQTQPQRTQPQQTQPQQTQPQQTQPQQPSQPQQAPEIPNISDSPSSPPSQSSPAPSIDWGQVESGYDRSLNLE